MRFRQGQGRVLQPTRYGVPSPALLARADRGFARFLAQRGEEPGRRGLVTACSPGAQALWPSLYAKARAGPWSALALTGRTVWR
ncbi:hypothetical protein [Streptomyces sp. NPDC059224]|uniref:hypothetical protein n=1 Tax=Streptomyces sp. NPDC059224 TaxID=3346775 RepID=UPI00369419C8